MPSTIAISPPPARERETLRQSAAYSAGGEAASRLVSLGAFVVLARLLPPRDFGLLAMFTVISGFLAVLLELGFAQALIHFPDVTDELYSTAFLLNVVAGAAVAVAVFFGAGWIARFYGELGLADLVKLVSLVFILNPIAGIQAAILQKAGSFRPVALVEVTAVIAGAAVAMVLASRDFGAWALAWNVVAVAATRAALYSTLAPRRAKPKFAWPAAGRLWRYGRYVLFTNLFNYAALNLDQLLIGKFLGPALLGAYRYAGQLVSLPQNFVTRTLNTVLLSWYSQRQDDPETIKATHLRVLQILSFYTLPALSLAAVLADCLVLSVLGRKWQVLIVVIQFIAVVEMIQVLGAVNGPLLLSQGKTRKLFLINLLRINVLLGVLLGLPFGLHGVLSGLVLARLVNFYPVVHFVGQVIGVRLFEYLRCIAMNSAVAAAMAGGLLLLKLVTAPDPESIPAFLLLTACGAFLYVALSYLVNRGVLLEALRMLPLRLGR